MKQLTLYGNDGCAHCVNAKEWLNKNSIPYTMKDTSDEANQSEFKQYNSPGIPLLVIKDHKEETEEKIIGFRAERYEKAIL